MRSALIVFAFLFSGVAQSATIYHCNAWAGGSFWSTDICSNQKAHLDRAVTVPDGMPFQMQADFAQRQLNQTMQSIAPAPQYPNVPGSSCPQLSAERRALDEITEKMIWVPIEKQNANYHRMNQIKVDMARLGCRYP